MRPAQRIIRKRVRSRNRPNPTPRAPLIGLLLVPILVGLGVWAVGSIRSQGDSEPPPQLRIDLPPFEAIQAQVIEIWDGEGGRLLVMSQDTGPAVLGQVPSRPKSWTPLNQYPPELIQLTVIQNSIWPLAWEIADHLELESPRDPLLIGAIDQTYSIEQRSEFVLNSAHYGELAFGIEEAAALFFGKSISQLSLAELTFLLPLPFTEVDPRTDFETAKTNQEALLAALLEQEIYGRESITAATFTPLTLSPIERLPDSVAPEFTTLVLTEAIDVVGAEAVRFGGLSIMTTLDLSLQQVAACTAEAHLARLSSLSESPIGCPGAPFLPPISGPTAEDRLVEDAAVVMLDPRTGEIIALVGDVATESKREPGPVIIPWIGLTALSQGYTAGTMLLDIPTDFGTPFDGVPYEPENRDTLFLGPISLRESMAGNRTVPLVELLTTVGINTTIRNGEQLGVEAIASPNRAGPDLLERGGRINLLDATAAIRVLANQGVMSGRATSSADLNTFSPLRPISILWIDNPAGERLWEPIRREQEVVSAPLAFLLNDMLSDTATRCQLTPCPSPLSLPNNRPAAVVSGETDQFRDSWTIGYTPQLVTGVWVGNRNDRPTNAVSGVEGAAPIWHALMAWQLDAVPAEVWVRPDSIIERPICMPSGLLPNGICDTRPELFASGTEPIDVDRMVQAVSINRETGRLATVETPIDRLETEIFIIYPPEAAEWVDANQIPQPPTEYDTISAERPSLIEVTQPLPFALINTPVSIRGQFNNPAFIEYRIAFFKGLSPSGYQLIQPKGPMPNSDILAEWDTDQLEDGLYTIVLTGFFEDGNFAEHQVAITIDRTAPQISIQTPRVSRDPDRIPIEVELIEGIGIQSVQFYVDDESTPFAIREAAPYSAEWVGPSGCHRFRVRAIDTAGNLGRSQPTELCTAPE